MTPISLVSLLAGDLADEEYALVVKGQRAISEIVLWALAKLIQIDRLSMDLDSLKFCRCLRELTVIPTSLEIVRQSTQLDFSSDPPDEIIAATSLVEKITLLTHDRSILKSRIVPFAL